MDTRLDEVGTVGERGTRHCRGYMLIDVTGALVIVAALAVSLAVGLGRQHRMAQKMADTRAALAVAEAVLADLQAGRLSRRAQFEAEPDVKVDVRPAAGGRPGATDDWVEVAVTVRAGRAELAGAVPEGSSTP